MLLHDCVKLIATGTEEVADLKRKLDSLYQGLEHVEPATQSDGIVTINIGSVREKLKLCMDQCRVALSKIKTERQDLLDCIEKLQWEKNEISEEITALKHDLQGTSKFKHNNN